MVPRVENKRIAVSAREKAVFQRELENRRLDRCPLCDNRGRRMENQGREGQQQSNSVAVRMAAGVNTTTEAAAYEDESNAPIDRARPEQLIRERLEQRNEGGRVQATGNAVAPTETREEMCAALRMTLQRSPFLWEDTRAGVELHGRLQRRRTPYPRITTIAGGSPNMQQYPGDVRPWAGGGAGNGTTGAEASSRTKGPDGLMHSGR